MTTLTIDIGDTKLAATLVGADGQIRDHQELPMPASQTPQALRDALSVLVSPLQTHAQRAAIVSAGVTRGGSLLVLNPRNPNGLLHFPLIRTLGQLINLPTIAINGAQATTWAKCQAPDGDITDMVFITVSTGVGSGVMSGGKPHAGPGGLAGHIGYTSVDPYGPVCDYRHTGCVGAIASGRDIVAAAQRELAGADTKAIFTHAGQGDEQAQQLIHRSACTLAELIADIKTTTGYQCMVVDGNTSLIKGHLALAGTYLAQESVAFHVNLLAAHYRHGAGLLRAVLLAQGEIL